MKCDYCGKETFKCSTGITDEVPCDGIVPINEIIDGFHIGNCSSCGLMDYKLCAEYKK
jgi:hypothetical protein